MSVITMRKLLESGCHFGHQTRKWNPKMKPYIYAAKNGVYILDLAKTLEYVNQAYEAMRAIAEKGGKILFVGTKKVAQEVVMEEALKSGAFYVNQRWLGGLLTNYRTIQKRIRRLIEINEMEESGQINLYPKKEIAQIRKEGVKLDNFLGGIKEMKKLPDAVFVVDPTEDHNAVAEAKKCGIPVFGIVDTNCDPKIVDYPIYGNDDGQRSVILFVTLMADAIREAKGDSELVFAYKDEEEDISMADVIIRIEEQAIENERRRRAKMEERRQQQDRNRNYRGRESRFTPRQDRVPVKTEDGEVKKEEVKTEDTAEVTETPIEEIVNPVVETPLVEENPVEEVTIPGETPVVEDTPVIAEPQETPSSEEIAAEEAVEAPVVEETASEETAMEENKEGDE